MSLLDKAKSKSRRTRDRNYTPEHYKLAVGFLEGSITGAAFAEVAGCAYKNYGAKVVGILRDGVLKGKIQVRVTKVKAG